MHAYQSVGNCQADLRRLLSRGGRLRLYSRRLAGLSLLHTELVADADVASPLRWKCQVGLEPISMRNLLGGLRLGWLEMA